MEQSSQMLQYFDKLPTFNFNNAKIMQNLSKCFFDLALFCKIRLKGKIYVNYAKFCIEVFPDVGTILLCYQYINLLWPMYSCEIWADADACIRNLIRHPQYMLGIILL